MDDELSEAIAQRDQSRKKLYQSAEVLKRRLDRSKILFMAASDARELFADPPCDPSPGPARGPPPGETR